MNMLFNAISNTVPQNIDSASRGANADRRPDTLVGHSEEPGRSAGSTGNGAPGGASFADALASAREKSDVGEVKFSRHASERLRDRGIELSDGDVTKISQGVDRADAKGARDSLLLYGNLGLIVNVPNRTVVTAIDENSMQEKVFTNIDSTVIIPR